MRSHFRQPSPALVVSLIALFVALGGTGYAAVKINGKNLKNKSVAGKKLKNKTVTGGKIKNNTLTGTQIDESRLGKVPSATKADSATTADSATAAGIANAAFTASLDPLTALPAGLGPHTFLTLDVPQGGNYLLIGKFSLVNDDTLEQEYRCSMLVGDETADAVYVSEGEDAGNDDSRSVALTALRPVSAGADVTLQCNNPGTGAADVRAGDVKLTAVQVRSIG